MEDRIPTPGQEGRMLITPEDGSAPYYAKITMADNPTNPGTPLNKETLLQDATETALFGSANNRTVDDAFRGIANKIDLIMGDQAAITVTVTDQAGHPVTHVLVNGVYGEDGSTVYTNSSGIATGYISEGTQTISVTGYADLENISKQLDVVKGATITETLTPTRRNFLHLTQSQNVKFSGDVTTVDSNPVGGGGGAGYGALYSGRYGASGGAGAGGHSVMQAGISITPNTDYPAVIGSGGRAATENIRASAGGTSSFLGVTATGGNPGSNASRSSSGWGGTPGTGGTGNGNGANGAESDGDTEDNGKNGSIGTEYGYLSYTSTGRMGGGGGSGTPDRGVAGGKGAGYGGDGGYAADQPPTPGQDGYGGGGGSGGVKLGKDEPGYEGEIGSSARGGNGAVNIRIHFSFGELAS